MPRIIKAGQVIRIEDDAPARAGASRWSGGAPETAEARMADVQAAYDELITAAQDEVSLMLQDAREEAARIYGETERGVDKLREAARREGFAQGLEEAAREAAGLLERGQRDIDSLLGEAGRERDRMLRELEPKILTLAIEVAEKILGYELDNHERAYMSMLQTALANVKSENHVTLRVNPSEYVRFFKSRKVTMHTAAGSIEADVINDPTVGYGGCLIETESGAIDAGASAQLDQVARNFGIERPEGA